MKILFVSEFFPPVNFGGAEWSSYYLASALSKKKDYQVIVLTPNYNLRLRSNKETFKVIRYPFYLNLKKTDSIPSSINFINPIWFLITAITVYLTVRKNKIDLIHINGRYSIAPTRFANVFLKRKILVTARDYTLICNYGFCLSNNGKSCNLYNYFTKDFKYYINEYIKEKNLFVVVINLIFAVHGRILTAYLKKSALGLPIVLLSNKQKEIYKQNGYKKTFVVGNSISKLTKRSNLKRENLVIYAGRLTPGKGVNLLIKVIPKFFKLYSNFKFIFCGSGLLENEIKELSQRDSRVELIQFMDHEKLIKLFAKSKLVVMPSVWQEPFGRVALEALSQQTPTIVSNRGGLPEIINNERWGYVVQPNENGILSGISKGLKNNNALRKFIATDFKEIKNKYSSNITAKYIEIYKSL